MTTTNDNELIRLRKEKLKYYEEIGVNPFANGYTPKASSQEIINEYDKFSKEELNESLSTTSFAGRLMANRVQGKAGFATLRDNFVIYKFMLRKLT